MTVFNVKKRYLVFFLILCFGCSANQSSENTDKLSQLKNLSVFPAGNSQVVDMSFTQDRIYGSIGDVVIGNIDDIAIDDSGKVFIADSKKSTIHVFGSNGDYLTHIGRKGKGPGEFYRVSDVQIKDHKLFAYDLTRFRYHVFSLDSLTFRYTVNFADNKNNVKEISDAHLNSGFVRNNSTFLAQFTQNVYTENKDWGTLEVRGLYYLLDRDGNINSKKLMESKTQMNVLVPFQGGATDRQGNYTQMRRMGYQPGFYGKALLELSEENHIYWAWTDTFLIKVYSPEGEYQRAINYQYKNVPLSRESATKAGIPNFILKGWQSMNLPKNWPALNNMKIDDKNRLWVSTIVENFEVYQWWVLKDSGELLTRFTWPRQRELKEVKNGYAYILEKDEETGLQHVVRYRIEME